MPEPLTIKRTLHATKGWIKGETRATKRIVGVELSDGSYRDLRNPAQVAYRRLKRTAFQNLGVRP